LAPRLVSSKNFLGQASRAFLKLRLLKSKHRLSSSPKWEIKFPPPEEYEETRAKSGPFSL
jgi:hypothetical protein